MSISNVATATRINPNFVPSGNFGPTDTLGSTASLQLAKRAKLDENGRPDASELQDSIKELLGNTVLTPVMSRNLDLYQGYPHSTTGIPYAIQGTASVINVNVSEYLATFQDPIKALLGTSIHREARVIITRKYVVGGQSLITPEHAPARTVSIQEDAREVVMTRYGGDIEMNLNLFLRPEDAKEELDLKVGAQRRELERTLVNHGYRVLMEEGTNITDAIIRSNPTYSTSTNATSKDVIQAAERINITTVFGAMSKNCFPVQTLLAAAKYASAYTTTNDKGSVLLLPHGSPDILRHTRRENMIYSITGKDLLQRNNGKPIDMSIDNAYKDPSSNVSILIHRPMPTFDAGVANPDVGMSGLTDIATFGVFYKSGPDSYITDFDNRSWHKVPEPTADFGDFYNFDPSNEDVRTVLEQAAANSGALSDGDAMAVACQGKVDEYHAAINEHLNACTSSDTCEVADAATGLIPKDQIDEALGRLRVWEHVSYVLKYQKDKGSTDTADIIDACVAFDNTMVAGTSGLQPVLVRPRMEAVMSSAILAAPGAETGELLIGYPFTSVSTSSTEICKIQLRVYLSAVLKRPENVLIMRHVFFEGLHRGHGVNIEPLKSFESDRLIHDDRPDLTYVPFPKSYMETRNVIDYADFTVAAVSKLFAEGVADASAYFRTHLCLIMLGIIDGSTGDMCSDMLEAGIPTRLYMGTVKRDDKILTENNGHLGALDNPKLADRCWGSFVYNPYPDPNPPSTFGTV